MPVAPPDTIVQIVRNTVAIHDTTVVRDTVFQYLGRVPLPFPIKPDDGITSKDVLSWLVPAAVAAVAALWGTRIGAKETRRASVETLEREWQLERRHELTGLKARVESNLDRIDGLCDLAARTGTEKSIPVEIPEELEVMWNMYYRVSGPIFRLPDRKLAGRIDTFFMELHTVAEEIKAFEAYALDVWKNVQSQPGTAEKTAEERQKWPLRRGVLLKKVSDFKERARDYRRKLLEIKL